MSTAVNDIWRSAARWLFLLVVTASLQCSQSCHRASPRAAISDDRSACAGCRDEGLEQRVETGNDAPRRSVDDGQLTVIADLAKRYRWNDEGTCKATCAAQGGECRRHRGGVICLIDCRSD
jgi:hypothetical protein